MALPLLEKFPEETKEKEIIVLDIEDNYKYMDKELIEVFILSLKPYLSDL